jgi:hypothetical protein
MYHSEYIKKKPRIGFYWGNLINNLQYLKTCTNIYHNDTCSSIDCTGFNLYSHEFFHAED